MAAATASELQSLYIAYFGRPADPAGLSYWLGTGIEIKKFASIQFAQSEFQAANAGLSVAQQVNNFYLNAFGRNADSVGLNYWVDQINSGKVALDQAGAFIVFGAQPADKIVIESKTAAATAWTNDVKTDAAATLAYNPTSFDPWVSGPALADGVAFLAPVLSPATIPDAAATQAAVDAMAGSGTPGQTFNLTTAVDTITISTIGTTDNVDGLVSNSLVGGILGTSTWTPGDSINGNGLTKVNLTAVDPAGNAAFGTIKNVAEVNLTYGGTDGSGGFFFFSGYQFQASTWENVGSINLVAGADDGTFEFTSLEAGTDLSIGNSVAGVITAEFTDDINVLLRVDRNSSVSFVDGTIDATIASNGDAYASVRSDTDGAAITLGDVTMTGSSSDEGIFYAISGGDDSPIVIGDVSITDADFNFAFVSAFGDDSAITLGDVTITGSSSEGGIFYAISEGDDSPIVIGDVSITDVDFNYAFVSAFGDDSAVTVGDVTQEVGDDGAAYLHVLNTGDKAGDITVGNVSITGGEEASLQLNISSTDHSKDSDPGNITVGTIDLTTGGTEAGNSRIYAYVNLIGYNQVGDITLGDVSIEAGDNADGTIENAGYSKFYANVYNDGDADNATSGLVTVGDVSITLGVDSSYVAEISNYAWANSGDAANGGITVGDITLETSLNSEIYLAVYSEVSASLAGGTATVGDTTIGTINASLGKFSYIETDVSITASGFDGGSSTVGNISIGGIVADVGVSATFDFDLRAYSESGSIGAVSLGNVTSTATTGAYVYVNVDISADVNVGDVSIGDVNFMASGISAENYGYLYGQAADGTWGDTSVGNITTTATGKDSYSIFELNFSGETAIGNTTVGNVTASAIGANAVAYAYVNIQNDGSGSVGTITIGDVALTTKGDNADSGFYVQAISAETTGLLTVGDVSMTVGNDANKTGALTWLEVENEKNSVVIGNISINGTTVQSATDTNLYGVDINITANGTGSDITIGNVTVTGGDTVADNFDIFAPFVGGASWINAEADDRVTIGNIDYSGYATGVSGKLVTIDLEGTRGAATIIGSKQIDTITDNRSTNAITGGAGNDIFQFVNTNTGLTLATADSITDWNVSEKINVQAGFLDYNEGSVQTSFADFLTDANGSNTTVYAGQIAEGMMLAFDYNNDDTVDSLVLLKGVTGYANISAGNFNFF